MPVLPQRRMEKKVLAGLSRQGFPPESLLKHGLPALLPRKTGKKRLKRKPRTHPLPESRLHRQMLA